jgi:hypothetical protein
LADACLHAAEAVGPTGGERTLGLLERACSRGSREGCSIGGPVALRLASRPETPEIVREHGTMIHRAIGLLTRACDAADGESCTTLGRLVLYGVGLPGDPKRAATLFEDGCKDGDADACERARPTQSVADRASLCRSGNSRACQQLFDGECGARTKGPRKPICEALAKAACDAGYRSLCP